MNSRTISAIDKNEFYEFLAGFPEYEIRNTYSDLPTDPSLVIEEVRELLVTDAGFQSKFISTLTKLSIDKERGWLTPYYLFSIKRIDDQYSTTLISDDTISMFGKNLVENKSYHIKNLKWVGAMYPDGVWGDIKVMNKNFYDEYGLWIIPFDLSRAK